MEKTVLTKIEFARTIFKAWGSCPSGAAEPVFFLLQRGTERVVRIPDAEICGETFYLDFSVLAADDDAPLSSGDWMLCVGDPEGGCHAVAVTDALYDQICQFEEPDSAMDLEVDRSEENFYHVYSCLNSEDFTFYLKVECRFPDETEGILRTWVNHLKNRHRNRLRIVRRAVFRGFFRFFNRAVRKTGNKVLFTSDSRSELGGNEAFIYRRMIERGMDRTYQFRFDFKNGIKSHRMLKSKILFTYYLATSDYIFTDDYQPELYLNEYDPSVKIIQVWHACGAFKTVGFERLGAKGAPAFNTSIHKCYTHVLVSSEHSAKHNAEAFAISRDKFYPTGVPRTDVFFDEAYKEEVLVRMHGAFPQVEGADRVILYAPTFRGINERDASFPMHVLHFKKIGECLKRTNSIMIVKMHPFVKEKIEIPEEYKDCFLDASGYREVNDILFITDLLITDYSSVIYEASLLNIPMLFYAFDLNRYIGDRGFYEPYEQIVPGKIVKTLPALLRAIEEEDYESDKLKGFIEKNFKYTDGKSTDRAIDLIFGEQCAE